MYYANEDGTSYLFTREYYYKKDVSAGLYVKAEGYGKIRPASYTVDQHKVVKRLREKICVTSRPRVLRPRNVGSKVSTGPAPQDSDSSLDENAGKGFGPVTGQQQCSVNE
ncbi:hypothetical protein AVEN_216276-1, partial [Araneus ventricosus]